MISLPNSCRCSTPSVHPKNWKTTNAKVNLTWYILYRFYEDGKKPKQVMLKGMNIYSNLKSKQTITENLIANELKQLQSGYNPNSKVITNLEADTSMQFIEALQAALKQLHTEPHTTEDIASVLRYVSQAAKSLGSNNIPIAEIRRKHLRQVLDKATEGKSSNTFNHYRKYLSILFKELLEMEAVEFNPVRDIAKRKTVKKIRQTLTPEERVIVDKHLKEKYFAFWRFLQIFFHGGVRIVELMRLQFKDVDLASQRYKTIIKKGRSSNEVWKIITNEALPYWQALSQSANINDFVFSKGLIPGAVQIKAYQITKRWYRLVKKPLNISCDFYACKHLKATMVSEQLGHQAAAKLASHTSTAMIVKFYDIDKKKREDEALKNVVTPFV